MNIFDLGFTAAYRKLERSIADQFRANKAAAITRIRARNAAERRNAAIDLLLEDASFHQVDPASLLGADEETGYKSCLDEDFPDGL